MIYVTGDKHADFRKAFYFCYANKNTLDNILIVLGDVGIIIMQMKKIMC